ncbi:hypothetical protein D7X33_38205 [Butyricicoccus sp. 1XD8-22]|nr:hypothetical protein D7X33_38205 [Butyricicoccus sp. 1XD8-22]
MAVMDAPIKIHGILKASSAKYILYGLRLFKFELLFIGSIYRFYVYIQNCFHIYNYEFVKKMMNRKEN